MKGHENETSFNNYTGDVNYVCSLEKPCSIAVSLTRHSHVIYTLTHKPLLCVTVQMRRLLIDGLGRGLVLLPLVLPNVTGLPDLRPVAARSFCFFVFFLRKRRKRKPDAADGAVNYSVFPFCLYQH